jgi:UDP-N-acetylglucosamine--N-acetylmuramyl-(pentapeptide) pyrophosphoryl-undecaprenol N-acetylglucosamine transferase
VSAELTPFIEDTATAFSQADLIICRSGASTVTEIAAVGAAALYVPFPFAVDDHQTTNAQFIVQQGGGWLVQQAELTPESLAAQWLGLGRAELLSKAEAAWTQKKINATHEVVSACEELAQ